MQASGMHASSNNASSSRHKTTFSDLAWPSSSVNAGSRSASRSSSLSSGKLPTKRNQPWFDADTRLGLGMSSSKGSPHFSKLLGTVLGSPFGMTNDVSEQIVDGSFASVPDALTITRSPSPATSMDFSLISVPPPSPTSTALDLPTEPDVVLDVFSAGAPADSTPTCSFFVSPAKRGDVSPLYKTPSKIGKGLLPRLWDALSTSGKRGRSKLRVHLDGLPLDGEEGELIDDEACFIQLTAVTGIDIISQLPTELSLYLLLFLDLPSVLACTSVSRRWRAIANDNLIWRELFYRSPGWKIDAVTARRRLQNPNNLSTVTVNSRLSQAFEDWSKMRKGINSIGHGTPSRLSTCSTSDDHPSDDFSQALAPLSLNWQDLYKTRKELDLRWTYGEPKTMRIAGHEDSVYCLEFDSQTIITGSRDKTIKIWSLRTGKLQATLRGHAGSVLCLKFDKSGFMVSGSSDCSVFVWDLNALTAGARTAGSGAAAAAAGSSASAVGTELVRRVLKGHTGGVLDLRIDDKWIVSCSKDALIRVWCRRTLTLFATLRGHEGPVNAVGLQDGKVVSASGDGKMMLWDIATSTRIKTFEGHDRGLACIEFKDDLIVSGSNDCKIKVWSASTGECLRTLVGHDLLVRALSFDPVSKRLVSASYDKTVKIWDLATGKMVREFKNSHSSHIFDVKFDACRIVSTSHDQKVVVLDFSQDLDTSLFL